MLFVQNVLQHTINEITHWFRIVIRNASSPHKTTRGKYIIMKLSTVLLVSIFSIGNGFIFEKPLAPLKNLNQLVEAQSDHRLSVSLDIGKSGDNSRLAINNLIFDLSEHAPTSNDQHIKMPGAHGPHPSLSSGIRRLTTIKNGSFISMNGSEVVNAI